MSLNYLNDFFKASFIHMQDSADVDLQQRAVELLQLCRDEE